MRKLLLFLLLAPCVVSPGLAQLYSGGTGADEAFLVALEPGSGALSTVAEELAAACGGCLVRTLAPVMDGFVLTGSSVSSSILGADERVLSIEPLDRNAPLRFLVQLLPGAGDTETVAYEIAAFYRGEIGQLFEPLLRGFSIDLALEAALELASDARVEWVERSGLVELEGTQLAPLPWGLDRIDQRKLPLSDSYSYGNWGGGVWVYVVDSGIAPIAELGVPIRQGISTARIFDKNWGWVLEKKSPFQDCTGHGTTMARIITGLTDGVAKAIELVPVRVFPCDGNTATNEDVVSGLDWIFENHPAGKPGVVNLSFGHHQKNGQPSKSEEAAVRKLVAAGLVVVASAGNDADDACGHSPGGRVAEVITVGATTSDDHRYWKSNMGFCLDLFAPGMVREEFVVQAPVERWGTSVATAYASGVAALYLENDPTATPEQIEDRLIQNATAGVLDGDIHGKKFVPPAELVPLVSPNLLLYAGVLPTGEQGGPWTELIRNGGFESDFADWSAAGNAVVFRVPISAGEGVRWLGFNDSAVAKSQSEVWQEVTIPGNAKSVILTYNLRVETDEVETALRMNTFEAALTTAQGGLLAALGTSSNQLAPGFSYYYSQKTFDVSQLRGKTLRLSFRARQTDNVWTMFALDGVSLKVRF